MEYTTLAAEVKGPQALTPHQSASLYEICHHMTDGRAARGKRSVHLAIDGKVLRGTGKQPYGGEKPQKWAVENRLHWRRDVTLGEDRCGVRVPPVAQMLAVLNSFVLSLMDIHQVSNVAHQIRRFVSHPGEALAWLL